MSFVRWALFALLAASIGAASAADTAWIRKIRKDHPRLFFNAETWPEIKARTYSTPSVKACLDHLLAECDRYPEKPVCQHFGPVDSNPATPIVNTVEWGEQAARCALAWRFTGEAKYLAKVKEMLRVSIEAYRAAYRNRRAVHWYSTKRILALCAYDWVYEALTDDERRAIIVPLLEHVEEIQPREGGPFITRRNTGPYVTGFYGVQSLLWYAGLAGYCDGYNDKLAEKLMTAGYAELQKLMDFRVMTAGDDGGLVSAVPDYSMGAYPWAHFNFFHTWYSATGENPAMKYPTMGLFPNWIWWTWIPAENPARPFCFGYGDDQHEQNFLDVSRLYEHMTQYMFFYKDADYRSARLAATLRKQVPAADIGRTWPMYPFILPIESEIRPFSMKALAAYPLRARHFETLGQVVMRSGWTKDDVYCLYTTGGAFQSGHKHYDDGNFVIYKHDFLALDSGTRAWESDVNLRYYYCQTVAHNCVLVHKPGEPMPEHWGFVSDAPEAKVNHGGQYAGIGQTLAFQTNERFTYIASDQTKLYREKCHEAIRQFVHIQPDVFVVYDRVTASDPSYRKEWLLHTENEPKIEDRLLTADLGKGRIFCETLLPENAVLSKVGGPGKEYWASGKNWEINPKFAAAAKAQAERCGVGTHFGNWRLEVTPGAPAKSDVFLHVLTAADTTRTEPVRARMVREGSRDGVIIEMSDGPLKILFNRTGKVGASVNGVEVKTEIQAQSGVFPYVPE